MDKINCESSLSGSTGKEYPVKWYKKTSKDHLHLFLSVLLTVISLICILFGMVNGFWARGDQAFSYVAFIASPSGIVMLIIYLVGLNILYYLNKLTGFTLIWWSKKKIQ